MQNCLTLEEATKECDSFFDTLEKKKEYSFSIYHKIQTHMDCCLQTQTYHSLLDLLPYFEDSEYKNLQHSAETRRVYILLCFLAFELKHKHPPFISTATDYRSFMEQYMTTVFALRRVELGLDIDFVQDAIDYLNSIPLNVYAATALIENEYFENFENLCRTLYDTITHWDIHDKIQWLEYFLKKIPQEETLSQLAFLKKLLFELASLNVRINDFKQAYTYLSILPFPDENTKKLMEDLKQYC